MANRGEEIPHRTTDPLGRRVRRDEKWILFLEAHQFTQQGVVLGVGDLRLIQNVIAIAVIAELLAQLLDALFDFLGYRWG
jgi:hypothetical protein